MVDSASVDSIVCDPPYEIGFMGKGWDATGVAYDPATWAEAMRVLKPGAHMLVFGGTRTWHRVAVAVEDAGFQIRDTIMWLYGSGFPKSLDVSKAIDKAAGAEREVVGTTRNGATALNSGSRVAHGYRPAFYDASVAEVTAPSTVEAKQWQGWGTALKPAHEPIIVARKPFAGTVANNVLSHGTGAINVDGCRVGTATRTNASRPGARRIGFETGMVDGTETQMHEHGRWPPNVVLSHVDGCGDVCAPGCAVGELDEQSGIRKAGSPVSGNEPSAITQTYGQYAGRVADPGYADTGTASRFFPTFRYQAKAPSKERPTVDGVQHPTVKPLALVRWLVRLVTPPGGLVLDQFAGSGTTAEAALLEGFRVVAVDNDPAYLPLIRYRVARALKAK
jgi:DNA methylase